MPFSTPTTLTEAAVEPFHMERYLDEQMFRFNTASGTRMEPASRRLWRRLVASV
jgi:hypothetical protein